MKQVIVYYVEFIFKMLTENASRDRKQPIKKTEIKVYIFLQHTVALAVH